MWAAAPQFTSGANGSSDPDGDPTPAARLHRTNAASPLSARRMVSGRDAGARYSHEWRVLAGFWPKNSGAGCVPSLISACAAADARRGYFLHCLRGVRARSERPLDSDAPSPPTPFFAQPEGAGGIPSDGISKKAVLDGARWINGGPLMQVSLRVGRAASMRRVGSASGVAC
jgi:hypothetical protein